MIREHSEYYADEIDRLPNEPEPEIIPQDRAKNAQNRIDNVIEIQDVNVDIEEE